MCTRIPGKNAKRSDPPRNTLNGPLAPMQAACLFLPLTNRNYVPESDGNVPAIRTTVKRISIRIRYKNTARDPTKIEKKHGA